MKAAGLLVAAALAAAVLGTWLALRPAEAPAPAAPATGAVQPNAVTLVPGATPRAGDAPARAPQGRIAMAPPKSAPAGPFADFLAAKQYRGLYDRLQAQGDALSPEGRLALYEILRECAQVTDGRRPGYRANPPAREEFVTSVAPTDPQRERRIAAYDALTADRCAGFEGVAVKRADLIAILESAAAAGDPRARALALEQQLWTARREGGGGWRDGGVTLTDAQVEELKQIAGTRDPEAIRVAGRLLANAWHDYQLRIGPDQQPIEQRPFVNAWLLLACEYGAPCGADTPRLQQACALQGHCARDFAEYLSYYGSTPADTDRLLQYRMVLRNALESGDWSQLHVVRGAPPGANRMTFVPGPR